MRLPLRAPLRTAWGELAERELLRVRLELADFDWGEGEAAPLEPYDGVPAAAVAAALEAYGAVLADAGPGDPAEDLLAACRAERALPRAAAAAARAGFACVKVKVGVGDDAGRLGAVRAAVGPAMALRADANGAWASPDEALANLRALAPLNLELCEEPVHGVAALRAVRAASPVPVAMDETAAEPGGPGSGAADAVCLKVTRGGITGALRDAHDARAAGCAVYV